MAENDGGSSTASTANVAVAAPDYSPSLASVVGEMYGDYRDAEPEPESGASPDATPEHAPTPTDPEGAPDPSEPAGEPPAVADAEIPPDSDPEGTTGTPDIDPLEGARALDYLVNGETRSYDGITVLKDGGAIIDPERVQDIQRKLGERDHLYEQNRAQFAQYSALDKATAWLTKDASGKEITLTGLPAAEARQVALSRALGVTETLRPFLEGTADPYEYLMLDANNQIVWNPHALKTLRDRAEVNVGRRELQARQHFARFGNVMPAQPAAPAAPVSVESVAMPTVELTMQQLNVGALGDTTKQFLASQLPRYVRDTTPAEKEQGFGPRVVDASFGELVKREAANVAASSRMASTATSAAKSNASRLAAAATGAKGGKQPPKIAPQKTPVPSRADDFDTLWDRQEKAAAGALRAAR